MAPNFSAVDERAVSHLDHPWLRLDGCVYTRVTRLFSDLCLARSHHFDVIANNMCVYDQCKTTYGGHKFWFLKSLSGPYSRLPFNFIALALRHTTQMKERCAVPCCLHIAGYEAMLKHIVDGLWHTAPGATASLAPPASLEPAVCRHPTR